MNKNNYLALLRGINVGGNNIIKMADLRASFEQMGFENVKTYIQSGNVLFATSKSLKQIETKIKKQLAKDFDYHNPVLVIPASTLLSVIKDAPENFGQKPKEYKYDVAFLIDGIKGSQIIDQFELNPDVDAVWAGEHAVYYRRLIAKLTRSRINKIIGKPVYKQMTVRNWNTTTKIMKLFEDRKNEN